MTAGSVTSDKGIGLGMAFAALTLIGAVVMYAGDTQLLRAWGFGAAMIASIIGVVAIHLFWD
ncbi:DUF7525 family protein [Natronocalculus amylovorans]|uniref:Uncharacterized protein n=1 Tax=Natronocalculus amylovorans TaxID=2917812 RepID=A0AAE3FXG7_9EURY|nr:hypothetical protein [Natronocalculus amylovorans]MCL9817066.1 hypothetical protein [Natronocalculus amylovorans]NUE02906.1 hypothetical protein [Halorubraceae archaeon YAN]